MREQGRTTRTARSGRLVWGGVALAGAAGGAVLRRRFDAWALAAITRPARRLLDATPADLGLAYDEVRLRSADAVDLYGWIVPAPGGLAEARATLILGHGHSDTMGALLGFAAWLQAAGYNLLLLDFRGHGRSGGTGTSVGYLEHQDIGAGLRYLAARGLHRVGVMGWSLGAAAAITGAALYPALAGVVADSAYARLASPLAQAAIQTLHQAPWLARVLGLYGERLVGRGLGFDPAAARPDRLVGRISPRPLLIIHSEQDTLIPVANAYRLYAQAGPPKDLWVSQAGDHATGTHTIFPAEYRRRVLAFWDQVFPGPAGREDL